MAFRNALTGGQFPTGMGSGAGASCRGRTATRRQFLRAGALAAAGLASRLERLYSVPDDFPYVGGKFTGLAPFEDDQVAPTGTLIGTELDGRLYTDLSRVSARRALTPDAAIYVRVADSRIASA